MLPNINKFDADAIKCNVCQRKCLIPDTQVGFCLSRKNIDGKIKSLLYGQVNTIQVDPIEKKPFYHFKPGSLVATIGSWGCNFRCKQCLNWSCSWGEPATQSLKTLALPTSHFPTHFPPPTLTSPKQIASKILSSGYSGIAFSYNEPVIWYEYALDIAKEFKSSFSKTHPLKSNPYCVFVTNGSWTKQTIDSLTTPIFPNSPILPIDAANIDLKGFSEKTYCKQGAFFGIIPKMAVYAQKKGIFLELTTLLIPTINDNPEELKKMTEWIVENLGPDTPWHLSQYDPALAPDKQFQKLPHTSIEQLDKAAKIGQKAGLNHIYIWAPAVNYSRSDTICPKCKKVVIHRRNWQVEEINIIPPNRCRFCQFGLNIVL